MGRERNDSGVIFGLPDFNSKKAIDRHAKLLTSFAELVLREAAAIAKFERITEHLRRTRGEEIKDEYVVSSEAGSSFVQDAYGDMSSTLFPVKESKTHIRHYPLIVVKSGIVAIEQHFYRPKGLENPATGYTQVLTLHDRRATTSFDMARGHEPAEIDLSPANTFFEYRSAMIQPDGSCHPSDENPVAENSTLWFAPDIYVPGGVHRKLLREEQARLLDLLAQTAIAVRLG